VTTVICAEFNAVRAGHLWPRSLLAPFTDSADLTPADRRAYTSYAQTERHKSSETIEVSFAEHPCPEPAEPRPAAPDPLSDAMVPDPLSDAVARDPLNDVAER
jgi:hypothetical protein